MSPTAELGADVIVLSDSSLCLHAGVSSAVFCVLHTGLGVSGCAPCLAVLPPTFVSRVREVRETSDSDQA